MGDLIKAVKGGDLPSVERLLKENEKCIEETDKVSGACLHLLYTNAIQSYIALTLAPVACYPLSRTIRIRPVCYDYRQTVLTHLTAPFLSTSQLCLERKNSLALCGQIGLVRMYGCIIAMACKS